MTCTSGRAAPIRLVNLLLSRSSLHDLGRRAQLLARLVEVQRLRAGYVVWGRRQRLGLSVKSWLPVLLFEHLMLAVYGSGRRSWPKLVNQPPCVFVKRSSMRAHRALQSISCSTTGATQMSGNGGGVARLGKLGCH